jgi:hypothetical protein
VGFKAVRGFADHLPVGAVAQDEENALADHVVIVDD